MFGISSNFSLNGKNVINEIKTLSNEIYKEYPDGESASKIGNYVLFYIGSKHGRFDNTFFGLTKKEGETFIKKITTSQNHNIQRILELLP